MNKTVEYIGKDLEAMTFAINYHNWILEEFRPFMGNNVVEVGAGTGSFSKLLLQEKLDNLFLIEPSEMFDHLEKNLVDLKINTKIHFHKAIFSQVCSKLDKEKILDSIIYVNVLEHIEDDVNELSLIYDTLPKGGRCFIFVPALMSLYGEFDRKIGHFRRYSKAEIEEKSKKVGFKVLKSKYFDLAGIIPWYIKYKLIKSDSLDSKSVNNYDRFIIPLFSRIEKLFRIPIGKNVLLILEK